MDLWWHYIVWTFTSLHIHGLRAGDQAIIQEQNGYCLLTECVCIYADVEKGLAPLREILVAYSTVHFLREQRWTARLCN